MYSVKKGDNDQITNLAVICANAYAAIPLSLEKYTERMRLYKFL